MRAQRSRRDAADASAVVTCISDDYRRELLSVTADNKPGEYEVYYAAEFSVTNGAAELISRTQVKLTRKYGYERVRRAREGAREDSLRAALASDIAELIMRRLAAL
jgi:outer membrane lipopolysaccharide assembly protein LptE/RlpB